MDMGSTGRAFGKDLPRVLPRWKRVSVCSHATGVSVCSHATGVSVCSHATGVTVCSHATGVSVCSHATGVWLLVSGSGKPHGSCLESPSCCFVCGGNEAHG
ncbi:hypothetical protein ACOMHN_038634 [Nucella lapillus]